VVKQIQKVMVVERMVVVVVVVVTAVMSQCVLIVDKNPVTSVSSVFIVSDRKLIRFFFWRKEQVSAQSFSELI